jgi:uncharacterized protein YjbJ (UPF0337 family)
MKKDQIDGAVKNAVGKAQEQTEKVIGSTALQVKGRHRQADGQAQKALGKTKEMANEQRQK